MSHVLQPETTAERPDHVSRVVDLDDSESESVFSTLSSTVARSILTELYRGPATQSELADRIDTSIQNASYHLDNLVEAGLAEVVDQWYSEKGRRMDVYAPAGDPLVLIVGTQSEAGEVHQTVSDRLPSEPVLPSGD